MKPLRFCHPSPLSLHPNAIKNLSLLAMVFLLGPLCPALSFAWERKPTPVVTPWGEKVTPQNAWIEYPRPALVREHWASLNGLWDFALTPQHQTKPPTHWPDKILVPFSVQSALGGVGREPAEDQVLWYRRRFVIPRQWQSEHILLHFEAADFETQVWVNGKVGGSHRGGYEAFSLDISLLLKKGENEIIVCVADQGGEFTARSVGKQSTRNTEEYENLTGIWQSVWLEPVSSLAHITHLASTSSLTSLRLQAEVEGRAAGLTVHYILKEGGKVVTQATAPVGEAITLAPQEPKLWSPNNPCLYDLDVYLLRQDEVIDHVSSYCAFRTIALDSSQKPSRILLNGKPLFQIGPLDQNYWPESGLTPPSDSAMLWEIDYLKSLGCNMVRIHITRKPRRYYYHCDRQGLLVWQDLVCGQDQAPTPESSRFWVTEQRNLIRQLSPHPSIVLWVLFNERWGQHNTREIYQSLYAQDTTRLWDVASGWDDLPGQGSVRDLHDYTFFPALPTGDARALVLGECGGFASAVPGHNWLGRSNKPGPVTNPVFGGFDPEVPRDSIMDHDFFRPTFTAGPAFDAQYFRFVQNLFLLKSLGLQAAVYTQLSDMKKEENGWLTFDRRVSKVDPERTAEAHRLLCIPSPWLRSQLRKLPGHEQPWDFALLPLKKSKDPNIPDALGLQKGLSKDSLVFRAAPAPFSYGFHKPTDIPGWDGRHRLVLQRKVFLDSIPALLSLQIKTYIPQGKGWVHTRVYVNGFFCMDETTRHEAPELKTALVPFSPTGMAALRPGANILTLEIIPGLDRGRLLSPPERLYIDFELNTWE